MDDSAASNFINSLVKNLQVLCHSNVEFRNDIEVVGHLYLKVDKAKKFNYIVDEKVCKNDASSTMFVSNSYHSVCIKKSKLPSEETETHRISPHHRISPPHRITPTQNSIQPFVVTDAISPPSISSNKTFKCDKRIHKDNNNVKRHSLPITYNYEPPEKLKKILSDTHPGQNVAKMLTALKNKNLGTKHKWPVPPLVQNEAVRNEDVKINNIKTEPIDDITDNLIINFFDPGGRPKDPLRDSSENPGENPGLTFMEIPQQSLLLPNHHQEHVCPICGAVFFNKQYLKDHAQGKHLDPKCKCECGQTFNWRTQLLRHRLKCDFLKQTINTEIL